MPERLKQYREMRDFERTPEPAGGDTGRERREPVFVIQEHHATALHWDFRLERHGVLVSWALPKGLPLDPKQNHLAVHTEDHPMEYATFEGEIPKGEYGGGKVILWDSGTYETHKFRDREVMVTLHGKRAKGKYVLFPTEGKNWMIHRMDQPEGPLREPMPERIAPMLAKLTDRVPGDDAKWGYEIKWDGIRAIMYCSAGRMRLESRAGNVVTNQYPELRALADSMASTEMVLDGEILAIDANGRPSFERLQGRMGLSGEARVRRRAQEIPATYMIFDLLYVDGHSTMALPYTARRKLLEALELTGPNWQTPAYHAGDGQALLDVSSSQNLEGIIAKRLDSKYEAGMRSGAWLKIKNHLVQDFILGGWTRRQGAGASGIGALLLGYYDVDAREAKRTGRPQRLILAGRAGTGYTEAEAGRIMAAMSPLVRPGSPFDVGDPGEPATFVEPKIVVRVAFHEWTEAGTLRQPSYKGMQPDIEPRMVVRE